MANHDEYPPEEDLVWTTDLKTVRKGKWRLGGDPTIPLEEGKWEDEEGNPIVVLQWTSLGESPHGPPPVPPPPRPIGEIIAEQSLSDPRKKTKTNKPIGGKTGAKKAGRHRPRVFNCRRVTI